MKKLYFWGICSLAAVALIAAAFFIGRWTAPREHLAPPGQVKIITDPQPDTPNQVTQDITGTASGHIFDRPWVAAPDPGIVSGEVTEPGQIAQADSAKPPPVTPVSAVSEQWSAEVPITGEVRATFTDKMTGQELGTETEQLTGTATVTGDQSGLAVKTVFDTKLNFAVETPRPAPPRLEVGAEAVYGDKFDLGWYVSYDFYQKDCNLFYLTLGAEYERLPDKSLYKVRLGITR
jgi:hypothetical protein